MIRQRYTWLNDLIFQHFPKITQHPSKLPSWVTPGTSHQMKIIWTMERKYGKNEKLSLIMNIKRAQKVVAAKLLHDQTAIEEKVFANRRMSDLQRYLKSLHKNRHLPSEMFLIEATNCTKAFDDTDKGELFDKFFTSVFPTRENFPPKQTTIPRRNSTILNLAKEKLKKSSNPWMQRKPTTSATSS